MSVENISGSREFDFIKPEYTETEKKMVPRYPFAFEQYRASKDMEAIEQLYLSHPDEDYSLRLRESVTPEGTAYTATLKDRGEVTVDGLKRLEIETPITQETYEYYKSTQQYPALHKLRAHPATGVTIDWIEGRGMPVIEIEDIANNGEARAFYEAHQHRLLDQSGSRETENEHLAHQLSPNKLFVPHDIDPRTVAATILRFRSQGISPIVVSISGRSGSGKSTITQQVLDLVSERMEAVRISTDDYHRGKKWLENTHGAPWTNWDAPVVYDTQELSADLAKIRAGQPIPARRFDFGLEETVIEGEITPTDLVLVEGIYAGSPDLAEHRHLHIAIPTPLATCIGRRIMRDCKNRLNASFGSAESILRYQLETAEPTFLQQPTL